MSKPPRIKPELAKKLQEQGAVGPQMAKVLASQGLASTPPSSDPTPSSDRTTKSPSEPTPESQAAVVKGLLVGLAAQVDTGLGSILNRFATLASPQMAGRGEAEFPRGLHRHPIDPERSNYHRWGDLLCFHAGNTVKALYDFAQGKKEHHLPLRIQHLREMAVNGPLNFVPYGDPRRGHLLIHKDAAKKQEGMSRG